MLRKHLPVTELCLNPQLVALLSWLVNAALLAFSTHRAFLPHLFAHFPHQAEGRTDKGLIYLLIYLLNKHASLEFSLVEEATEGSSVR